MHTDVRAHVCAKPRPVIIELSGSLPSSKYELSLTVQVTQRTVITGLVPAECRHVATDQLRLQSLPKCQHDDQPCRCRCEQRFGDCCFCNQCGRCVTGDDRCTPTGALYAGGREDDQHGQCDDRFTARCHRLIRSRRRCGHTGLIFKQVLQTAKPKADSLRTAPAMIRNASDVLDRLLECGRSRIEDSIVGFLSELPVATTPRCTRAHNVNAVTGHTFA